MTDIKRLFVLLCGYEILPKSISIMGANNRFLLSEPICAYLLDTRHGWVLLDAGMDPRHVHDPARRQAYFDQYSMVPPVIKKQHDLENQLTELGVQLADIAWIILSHLHFDHAGYIKHCPQARVSVQRREYESALQSDSTAYIAEDFNAPTIQWDLRDGDWDAFPGLTLLDTRGHSDGHQSALLRLQQTGPLILTFDAGDLRENFERSLPPGVCTDPSAALQSIRRLQALAQTERARLVLFHDPDEIQTLRLSPDHYT